MEVDAALGLVLRLVPVVDEGALVAVKHEPASRPHADTRSLLAEVATTGAGVQYDLLTQLNLQEDKH